MTKTKTAKRDKGYGMRRRQSLAARHDHHKVKVHTCPRCNPGGWHPDDVSMPTTKVDTG
jgi:hypothetical protein